MAQPDAVQNCNQFPKRDNNKLGSRTVHGIRSMETNILWSGFEWFSLDDYPYYSTVKHFPFGVDPAEGAVKPIWQYNDPATFAAEFGGLMDMGRYADGRQFFDGDRCLVGAGDKISVITAATGVPVELLAAATIRPNEGLAATLDAATGFLHPLKVEVTNDPTLAIYRVSKPVECNPTDCVTAATTNCCNLPLS